MVEVVEDVGMGPLYFLWNFFSRRHVKNSKFYTKLICDLRDYLHMILFHLFSIYCFVSLFFRNFFFHRKYRGGRLFWSHHLYQQQPSSLIGALTNVTLSTFGVSCKFMIIFLKLTAEPIACNTSTHV